MSARALPISSGEAGAQASGAREQESFRTTFDRIDRKLCVAFTVDPGASTKPHTGVPWQRRKA